MRLFLAVLALSAAFHAGLAVADEIDPISQKIISQGVPADALSRLYKFMNDNKNHDFITPTYMCLGKYYGTGRPCDGHLTATETVRIGSPQFVAIVDYDLPSTERRFYLIDLKSGDVVKYYVAHGKNSGGNYAYKFSNIRDSLETSLGIYMTGKTYQGSYGKMLRLYGLEKSNDQAYNRDIVVHGAWYVGEDFINTINEETHKKYNRLGLSWGCPALSLGVAQKVIEQLKEGGLIMHYQKDLMDAAQTGLEVQIEPPFDPLTVPVPTPRPAQPGDVAVAPVVSAPEAASPQEAADQAHAVTATVAIAAPAQTVVAVTATIEKPMPIPEARPARTAAAKPTQAAKPVAPRSAAKPAAKPAVKPAAEKPASSGGFFGWMHLN